MLFDCCACAAAVLRRGRLSRLNKLNSSSNSRRRRTRNSFLSPVGTCASASPWSLRAAFVRLNLVLGGVDVGYLMIAEFQLRQQIRHSIDQISEGRCHRLKEGFFVCRVDFGIASKQREVSHKNLDFLKYCVGFFVHVGSGESEELLVSSRGCSGGVGILHHLDEGFQVD